MQYACNKYLIKQELVFVADSVNRTRAINKKKAVQGLKKLAQPAEQVNHHRNILPDRLLFTDTSVNML